MLVPLALMVAVVPVGIVLTGRAGLAAAGIEMSLGTLSGWLLLLDHASGSTAVSSGSGEGPSDG